MNAAYLTAPRSIEVRETAAPEPPRDGLLLEVEACGICGTDLRTWRHGDLRAPCPWALGHEVVGIVRQVGDAATGIDNVKEGDRVFVASILACGECAWCRAGKHNMCGSQELLGYRPHPGAYAGYVAAPRAALRGVFPVPPGTAPHLATQADPLSNVINGQEILDVQLGDVVVVIGSGPIGCMHAHLALLRGASRVVMFDVADNRLRLARTVFPEGTVSFHNASGDAAVDVVMDATAGCGAERVIVACSSHDAQQDALRMAGRQATVLYFGGLPKSRPTIEFDSNILHYREVRVAGSYGANLRQMGAALAMIASGRIPMDRIVTHRFPLSHTAEAFGVLDAGAALKAVVVPDQADR